MSYSLTDLTHADAEVRFAAAQHFGKTGDTSAIPALIAALPDADSKVQYGVLSSLIKLKASEALHPILDVLLADTGSRVWTLINLNIGQRLRAGLLDMAQPGDLALSDRLHDILQGQDLNILQRALFVRMLGRTGDARRFDELHHLLTAGHPLLRGPAAEALGYLGDPRALAGLLAVLRDTGADDQVREPAAVALGQLGDPAAFDDLVAFLLDDNEFVRAACATALGKLGDRRAIEPLSQAMLQDTGMVSDAAFEALKQFSSGSYTTIL
ncbi:MAG: HEAT repeat domain-containing protein [Candidatus Flexifilum sp.]|jgi:HEAT repeat protein